MSEISDWFNSLPFFTRYWFGGTLALSLLGRFGLVPGQWLILNYTQIFSHFEIWRPITALFFYPISPQTGFHFLLNCYFLINYSKLLENGEYQTVPADYALLLLMNWISCVVFGLFMNIMVLMDPMVLSVLYVWCNLNADTIVSFWFGTQFRAKYLPWVLFGFNLILSGGGVHELIGILVGHLYFFLKYQYIQQYGGQELISTPTFLQNWFPPRRGVAGFGQPPPGRPAAAAGAGGGGHGWGRGNTLGG
ncbi:derlin-1 [Folsomia candida]|uniref:Derlin n=1 Tax=Folsomia candida TaxID=158441 RepID=A0A226DP04_FOLCA|nr:derlin-1 [Folsomia candida]OXA46748.1 Derlin-1 [Folsomia candida]